ncbi:hypothetical protein GpartN1_g1714.t1 [Galdieria partita]|uniref:Protein-L-isoaspartate O-methyltransferase n=1 Tax=Galdieria partita TaxID=83374 RepID=A0A9C7UNK6_9RHOD|nr:hypothetical protein GpartN1_g1714.t1 [Galdieria partita]
MRDYWIGTSYLLWWWVAQSNKTLYSSFVSSVNSLRNWHLPLISRASYKRGFLSGSKTLRQEESTLIAQVCCGERIGRELFQKKFLYQHNIRRAMAWLSRGRNQAELVKALKENGLIKTERVEKTLLAVDRGYFCKYRPYEDTPQPIGWNATISAPHMHVTCLELLNEHLKPGSKVLDIGSGSGYLTACMGIMVRPNGLVVGIEHIPGLAQQSVENLERSQRILLEEGVVRITVGDGRKGFPEEAPFDAIHVGAAAGNVPRVLLDQLAPGGRMLIPEGTSEQELVQYDKAKDGTISKRHITFVRYVPLCSPEQQIRGM